MNAVKSKLKRVVKLAVSMVVRLADIISRTSGSCVVLYYHEVPARERDQFARQMDYIAGHVTVLPADYEGALDAKKNYAVVTFDDGFVSVMENALPELQKHKMPATIFVPSGYLGQQPGWIKSGKKEWVMSPEQLRVARRGGLTIGSHTVRHVRLDKVPLEEAVSEMAISKQELEKILEEPVNTFSFPHGAFTPAVLDRAMKIGYTRVFGIEPARLTGQMNGFLVHRVAVNPSDWSLEFRLKVRGAYRWLEKKSK